VPAVKSIQSIAEASRSQPQIKSTEMGSKKESKNDQWIGWFRPLEKGSRFGPLIASPIIIYREERKSLALRKLYKAANSVNKEQPQIISRDLVVSIPGVCGTAVQRNRFRRMVKARFAKSILRGIRSEEIVESQENIANKSPRGSQSRKGLWIRLLNRHRLGQKIQVRDWQKTFDLIESQFCS
jgi:hypothetical protein